MKTRTRTILRITLFALLLLTLSLAVLAQQGGDPLTSTAQKVVQEFQTLAPYLVTIGVIIGGAALIFGHSDSWNRIGRVIIGGAIIIGASALVTLLFT